MVKRKVLYPLIVISLSHYIYVASVFLYWLFQVWWNWNQDGTIFEVIWIQREKRLGGGSKAFKKQNILLLGMRDNFTIYNCLEIVHWQAICSYLLWPLELDIDKLSTILYLMLHMLNNIYWEVSFRCPTITYFDTDVFKTIEDFYPCSAHYKII